MRYLSQLFSKDSFKRALLGGGLFLLLAIIVVLGLVLNKTPDASNVDESSSKQWLTYLVEGDFEKCDSFVSEGGKGILSQEFTTSETKDMYSSILGVLFKKCSVSSIEVLNDSGNRVRYSVKMQVPDYKGVTINFGALEEDVKVVSEKFVTGELSEAEFKTELSSTLTSNLLEQVGMDVTTKEVSLTLTDSKDGDRVTVEGTKGLLQTIVTESGVEGVLSGYNKNVETLLSKYR